MILVIDHFRKENRIPTVESSSEDYNYIDNVPITDHSVEQGMIVDQVHSDHDCLSARRAARGAPHAHLRRHELQGHRRHHQREHQHGAGPHALRLDQLAQDDGCQQYDAYLLTLTFDPDPDRFDEN